MRINFKGNSAKRAKLTEEFNIVKSNIDHFYDMIENVAGEFAIQKYNVYIDELKELAKQWIVAQPKRTQDGIIIVYKILNCDSHKLNKEWHNYPFDVKMPHIIISKEYKISRNSKYSYESLSLARKARKADVKAKAKAISAASKTVKPSDLYGEIKNLQKMIKKMASKGYNNIY